MRRLAHNLASVYAVYAVSIVSGLVVTPIAVHHLGTEAWGLWAFIGSMTVFLNLFDLGMSSSVIRFAAENRGRNEPEETDALASTGLVVYLASGLATLVVGVVLAFVVPVALGIHGDLVQEARVGTLLVAVGLALSFPLGLFGDLLLGQQRYDVVNLGNVLSVAVYAGLVALVLTRHASVVVLAGLTLVATALRMLFPLPWVRRELPFLRLRRSLVTRERIRRLLVVSSHNFANHLAGKLVFSTDLIVVGVLLGAKAAAFYGIPARIFALAIGLGTAGPSILLPALSEAEGAENPDRQRGYLATGLRVSMAVILLVALPLVLMPDLLIHAWIGPGYGPSTAVLALLGAVLVIHQPAHVFGQFLLARGRQGALARVLVPVSIVNLVLALALGWQVGIWGVALATVITETATTVVLIPRLMTHASGFSYRKLAAATLRPVLPAALVALPVLVVLPRLAGTDTLASLVPVGALWSVAFAAGAWRFGLSRYERTAVVRNLRPGRSRPALAS